MTDKETEYYEDIKSARRMQCDHGVDPVWYTAMLRKQSCQKNIEGNRKQFQFRNLETTEEILDEEGALTATETEEEETEAEHIEESSNPTEEASTSSSDKKKRKFEESSSSLEIEAPLPLEYRHVRHSERIIRDEVYETLANLVGQVYL